MRNYKIFLPLTVFILLFQVKGYSQFGIAHEIAVKAGPASFFTDYGERWNVKNNLNNAGYGIGISHYMNFAYKTDCHYSQAASFFTNHFRIRNELDYFYSKLEHFGPVARKNTIGGQLLRAMHGESEIIEGGIHLEYHPFRIRDFTHSGYMFSPYVSLGGHFVSYKADAYSDLGSLENPKNVFPTFIGGMDFERGSTYSIVGGLGVRYRLGFRHDLLLEARGQYYGSDWIDGLNINAPQNKFNDYIFWLNVGYVYYINFQ
ncbi:MAG: glutamate dehydrogenase [Salegentibacter mishustinae]|nr:glutamate dehydrogenase [Salegentibacter mishustinae]